MYHEGYIGFSLLLCKKELYNYTIPNSRKNAAKYDPLSEYWRLFIEILLLNILQAILEVEEDGVFVCKHFRSLLTFGNNAALSGVVLADENDGLSFERVFIIALLFALRFNRFCCLFSASSCSSLFKLSILVSLDPIYTYIPCTLKEEIFAEI